MDSSARGQLYSIKSELQSIINELEHIASGIQGDFQGIGENKCASRVRQVAEQYRHVQRKLNSIDTSKVTAQFAKSHGGTHKA